MSLMAAIYLQERGVATVFGTDQIPEDARTHHGKRALAGVEMPLDLVPTFMDMVESGQKELSAVANDAPTVPGNSTVN
jgi:hypothetical protein